MRNVRQILDAKGHQVLSVSPETPVLEVIRLMAEHRIGSVVVLRDGEVVGIATERDYARKIILQGRSSVATPVSTIMARPVLCVASTATANACMSIMTEHRIRYLPVIEDHRLIGLVSIGDLVKAVIEDQQFEIEQLQHYIVG